MKIEAKTKEKGFEPIELNITIETEDELVELLARLNISTSDVNKLCNTYGVSKDSLSFLWKLLDTHYHKNKS